MVRVSARYRALVIMITTFRDSRVSSTLGYYLHHEPILVTFYVILYEFLVTWGLTAPSGSDCAKYRRVQPSPTFVTVRAFVVSCD